MKKSNVNHYIIKIVVKRISWISFYDLLFSQSIQLEHVDLAIEILERMINLLNLRIKTLLDLRRQP